MGRFRNGVPPAPPIQVTDPMANYEHNNSDLNIRINELSPHSTQSISSSLHWEAPHQSLTILDWDDTLFPSTWLTETGLELCSPCPTSCSHVRELFDELAPHVLAFIRAAKAVSTVVIVTNASVGWVNDACFYWMPSLYEEIRSMERDGRVIYARQEFAKTTREEMNRSDSDYELPLQWKIVTFRQQINKFYGEGHSWKNVIGIGDSPHDQYALQCVCARQINPANKHTGIQSPMRVKTIWYISTPQKSVFC